MIDIIASQGGSDSPTPYIVNERGIELPDGYTFKDNGHINIRLSNGDTFNVHFEGKCINRTDAECAGSRHDQAQYIGKSFIPWSVFTGKEVCVVWVQLSDFNEHFGEGGQKPVGSGCETDEPEVPTEPETPVEPEAPVEPELPTEPELPADPETPITPEEPIEEATEDGGLLAPDTGAGQNVGLVGAVLGLVSAISIAAIRKILS